MEPTFDERLEFETKEFKDLPKKSYFYFKDKNGKMFSYRKESTNLTGGTAKDVFNKKIKVFSNYDEVLVPIQPKFMINF